MTTRHEFVVYLSSTLADLEPEREVALKTLAEFARVATSYRASEKGVVMTCTGDVRKCNLYIGILGQRYGYVPPVTESNPKKKSITELEYDACSIPGQPAIPRLMFIKPTESGIPTRHIDALSNKTSAKRMEAFLKRAGKDQTAYMFKNLDDLRAELRIRVKEKADQFHQVQVGTSAVRRWPCAQDFTGYLAAKREGFVGREWLFERVMDWSASGTKRSMLIIGDPGLGKSAIVAEMVERRKAMGVIAWFCCRWDYSDQLAPRVFVEAIAASLAENLPAYAEALAAPELQTLLEKAQTGTEVRPCTLFEQLVLSPLAKLPNPSPEPRIILIDALDESLVVSHGIDKSVVVPEGIVDLLADTLDHGPPWLRVVATTRPDPEILPSLHAMKAEVLNADAAENRDDLAGYVAGRLGLSSSGNEHAKSGDPICNGVLDIAQGNFLIADALIDEIRAGNLHVEELLHVNLSGGHPLLPPGLQIFYKKSFARLFPSADDFAPASAVLALSLSALEPLDRSILQTASRLAEGKVGSVLKRLASFLRLRPDKRFAFFHKSVRDWLDAETVDDFGEPIAGRKLFAIEVRVGRQALADWARQAFQLGGLKAPEYVLRHRVAHLKELGDIEQLRTLLFDFGWLSAKLARIGIQAVLEDFEQLPSALAQERVVQLLHRTLQMTAHILAQSPEQLAPQLLGRLSAALGPEIASLRQAGRNWRGRTWLCPLQVQMQPPGVLLRVLQGHENYVYSVAFSPDGTRIVSGSADRTLRLWDAKSGEILSALELDSGVLTVAWHDDNVAAGESKGAVQVFRVIEANGLLAAM